MTICADQPTRTTIALTDVETGWVFRLHNDNRRVWMDSFPTDAPVPLSFVAGSRAREFETVIGDSQGAAEMMTAVRLSAAPKALRGFNSPSKPPCRLRRPDFIVARAERLVSEPR